MSDLDDVRARLARLEDERDVLATVHAYGHTLDYGDEQGWVDCFTEDAVFEVHNHVSEAGHRRFAGRDALRELVAGHTRAPELWHKHVAVDPIVRVDGDTATCESYCLVLMEHEERPVIRLFGRYRDRLRRCDDGRWRLEHRLAEVESATAGVRPFVNGRPGGDRPAHRS